MVSATDYGRYAPAGDPWGIASCAQSFGRQPRDEVTEFLAQCPRLFHAGAESGRELPVVDGRDGLIHASGEEQQLIAGEVEDDLVRSVVLCKFAAHQFNPKK